MLLDELFEPPFLTEEQVSRLGGFDVRISPHVADQAEKRGVPAYLINTLLSRLKKVKSAIKELDPYEQFRLLDTQTGVVLGMMRSGTDPNKVLLNTVFINDHSTPKRDPTIRIR